MKRLLIVALVVVAALAVCAPAFAATPATNFTAVGKVVSVDPGASTMVVHVTLGSRGVKPFIGKKLTVTVAPNAKVLKNSGRWFTTISLADLSAGDRVTVVGAINRAVPASPVYVAKRVVSRAILPWQRLKQFGAIGPVVSVDAVGGKIVVHLKSVTRALRPSLGNDFTFVVAPGAKIFTIKDGVRTALTLADVVAGDSVRAFGSVNRSDPNAPVFTIRWMKVTIPAPAPTPTPAPTPSPAPTAG
jgi:hypothetical protein